VEIAVESSYKRVIKETRKSRAIDQSINQIQTQSDTDPISTHVNLKDETLTNQSIKEAMNQASPQTIKQTIHKQLINQTMIKRQSANNRKLCDRPIMRSTNESIKKMNKSTMNESDNE
jgi:hypothetical protein